MKHDYSIRPPEYRGQTAPDAVNRIQPFQITAVKQIRQDDHGGGSTPAWEITFAVPSLKKQGAAEQKAVADGILAAGMQIALLPVNDRSRVRRAMEGLSDAYRRVADGEGLRKVPRIVTANIPGRDGVKSPPQELTAEEMIAHTIDLTRPTDDLIALANKIRPGFIPAGQEDDYKKIPVEEFVNLPGMKGRISLEQLAYNQPPLENRKYTPSRVDPQKGEIGIMVSEVHQNVTLPDGRQLHGRGTTTGMLADMARDFLDDKPQAVNGFLDLRKHKLPYNKETRDGKPDKPKILISTGVGIAPHLAYLRECHTKGVTPNVPLLLTGDRTEKDHLQEDEIRSYLPEGVLHYAHSRPAQGEGQYVGQALREHGAAVWKALQEGGSLYLCGREDMREQVDASLKHIAHEVGQIPEADTQLWLDTLYQKKGAPKAPKQIEESMSFDDRFFKEKYEKLKRARGDNPQPGASIV